MFEVKLQSAQNLNECILIVPTLCVGNVAQLAVDLMLRTLTTEKIGYIISSFLYPFVGPEAICGEPDSKKGNLSTACEIFRCAELPLVIIQQRSPIIKGYGKEFCTYLKEWIKNCCFKKIVIMTGCFAHHRIDSQIIQTSQCRFLTSVKCHKDKGQLESQLNWKYMEINETNDDVTGWTSNVLPGSGVAQTLFNLCSDDEIEAIMCIIFCSEGNNCPEASTLASYVYDLILFYTNSKKQINNWITPISWKMLFGNEASNTLFC